MLYELPNGDHLTLKRVTGIRMFNDSNETRVAIYTEENRNAWVVCFSDLETARNWMRYFAIEVNDAKSELTTDPAFADLSSAELSRLKSLLHKDN